MTANFKFLVSAGVTGQNEVKRLGNSLQGVQGKAKNLGMAVKGVGLAFKALFAAAAVGGFSAVVKGAIDSADAFGKLSTRTGIAADKLQAFANAGKLADVSQSDLETGLRTLARTQAEAADGVATYADAYAKLGLSVKKADGSLKPSDQLLGEIADKFQDLPNGPEKAAVAMDIFGRSGSKLITLLNGGSEALERFNYETSENFAQNAEFFNDQITVLQIKFDGFRKQLADALLPALNAIVEVFSDLFDSGQDFTPLFQVIEAGIRGVGSVVLGLVQATKFFVRTLQDLVKIATLVGQGKFGEALGVAQTGLAETREQLFADIQAQQKMLFGRSEVGADYGGGGAGMLDQLGQDSRRGRGARQQKEAVKMSQVEFDLRQAIRDARAEENEIALVNAEFALEQFNIGNRFNDDVLGARNALLDAQQKKNLAIKGIEADRAAASLQAVEDARAAAQALLEADPGYQMKQRLEELLDVQNQVAAGATAVGNAFTNSFKAVVTGSKTAQEALADMMSAVAEHFLDMAAKIIAQQITMIVYGTIMRALGLTVGGVSGASPVPSSAFGDMSVAGPGFFSGGMIPGFANGGPVRSNMPYIVGERGPELFVPSNSGSIMSNADTRAALSDQFNARNNNEISDQFDALNSNETQAALERQFAARGTNVTRAALQQQMTARQSNATGMALQQKPIDVRYESTVINQTEYVTAEQHRQGMAQAAEQGRALTFAALQNNVKARRRIGL